MTPTFAEFVSAVAKMRAAQRAFEADPDDLDAAREAILREAAVDQNVAALSRPARAGEPHEDADE